MSDFNIYNVFLHAKHTSHNKTQSWLEQRLAGHVKKKGNKSGINYPGELTRRIPHGDTKYLLGTVVKLIQI
jgi:hypothetical protein